MKASELIKELLNYAYNGDMEVGVGNGKGVITTQIHVDLVFPKDSDVPDIISIEPDFVIPDKLENKNK